MHSYPPSILSYFFFQSQYRKSFCFYNLFGKIANRHLTLVILQQNNWLGNLRELRNVIRRSVLFSKDEYLTKENLPELHNNKTSNNVKPSLNTLDTNNWALTKGDEKEQIIAALKQARGNKTVAAKLLQIDRKTLYNKMHLYNIEL